MDSTTGGDANDEFARWLAETARAEQAAAQATPPAAPVPPAPVPPASAPLPPAPPAAQQPVAPPQFPPAPPAPDFFAAPPAAAPAAPAGPPTTPYEPQLGGPQVARSSYQSAGAAPAAPAHGAPPAPDYPAAPEPPATPAAPAPAAAELPPTVASPIANPAAPEPPSWAPGYIAPGGQDPAGPPAAPVYTPAPQVAAPPPAPVSFPPVETAAPQYTAPVEPLAPVYVPPPAPPVAAPAAPVPPAAPPAAFDAFPPPAPSFPDAAPSFPDAAPSFPEAAPAAPAADPFGPLFTTEPDDTAARLAASPPPSADPTPTEFPGTGPVPSDEDPMKSLFGLQTEEQPAIALDSFAPPSVAAADLPSFSAEPAAPSFAEPLTHAPAYAEPAFAAAPAPPVEPVYRPEPSFAAAAPAEAPAPAAAPPAGPAPSDDDPNAGTQFFGGGVGDWEEPPDLDRTTLFERIAFILAFTGPIGLVMSIVAAVRSSRTRGWVHRLIRAGIVIGIIFSIAVGILGAFVYNVLDQARQHDALEAASVQYCQTMADNPDMLSQPTFGFPAPAASVPDTLTAIQEYIDRWEALAKVSPSQIRADATKVADAASGILDSITTTRLVNNDENVAVMTNAASQTNIIGWANEYCG